MKKALMLLAIMLFFKTSFAGLEGTLQNRLYYQGGIAELDVEINEEYLGIGTLKICLSNYDFILGKYSSKCDIELIEKEIIINNNYIESFPIKLENIPDSAYRFYLKLTYKLDGSTKTRTDCDDNNFILVKKREIQNSINPLIYLSAETTNESIQKGITEAKISLSNNCQSSQIILYSFIKNSTHYINENLNDDSYKILNITPGLSAQIILKNQLLENISSGIYEYYIIAEALGKTYQIINSIKITENESQESNCPSCILTECEECPICPEIKECEFHSCPIIENESSASKITAKLNLKRDEYYYIPAIIIGIISLIIMYVKLK